MSNHFKLSIKGSDWTIRLLTGPAYNKKYGADSGAITLPGSKTIAFNKSMLHPGYIRHELLHALFEESNTESATLTPIQVEEVCASIIQNHWHNINMWTEYIIDQSYNKEV